MGKSTKVTYGPQRSREIKGSSTDTWTLLREDASESVEMLSKGDVWTQNTDDVIPGFDVEVKMNDAKNEAESMAAWKALRCSGDVPLPMGKTGIFEQVRRPAGVVHTLLPDSQMSLLLPSRLPIVRGDEEDTKSIANFTVDLLGETVHWLNESKKEILVDLLITMDEFVNDKSSIKLTVPLSEYAMLPSILRKRHPQCLINDSVAFYKDLALKYKIMHESQIGREKHKYSFGGWVKDANGTLQFLDRSKSNVECEVLLKDDRIKAQQFLSLYLQTSKDKGKLLILLMFVLWAPFAKFFEELNLEKQGLRTIAYVSAPTGTGKTSLVSCLTGAFLAEDVKPCLRFEDTEASIEEALFAKRDIATLVDDFFAQGTKSGDDSYRKKASALTRIAGDGLIKAKMGPDRKPRPDRKYRGSIIATGEFLDLNTLSSNLRCWHVQFASGSINLGESLATLSRNPDICRAYLTGWVRYLEEHQAAILKELPDLLKQKEKKVRVAMAQCNYSRLDSYAAALLVLGDFMLEYNNILAQCNFAPDEVESLVIQQAKEQMTDLNTKTPEEVWHRAVIQAVESGGLSIAKTELEFLNGPFDGFYAEGSDFVCCITGRADSAVQRYAAQEGVGIKITADVKKRLEGKGYIVPNTAGNLNFKYSKDRAVSPIRPRMYKIKLN